MSTHPLLQEALGLAQQGKHTEAVALLLSRVKEAPDDGAAWAMLGVCQSQSGQHAAARMAFQRAIDLQPADARFRFNYAVALERAGDRAGAAEQLRECLRCDPGHARARERLAAMGPTAGAAPPPAAGREGSAYTPPPAGVHREPARPPTIAEQMLSPPPASTPSGEAPASPPPAVPSFRPTSLSEAAPPGGRPTTVPCPSCQMHSRPGIVCEWCGASLPAPPAIAPSRTGVASGAALAGPTTTAAYGSPVAMAELVANIVQVWARRWWVWAILLLCPAIFSYLVLRAMPDHEGIARLIVLLLQLIFLGALVAGAVEEMMGGDVGVAGAVELFVPNLIGFIPTAILYWLIALLPSTLLGGLLAEPLAQTGWLPMNPALAAALSGLLVQLAIWLPVHGLIGLMVPISAREGTHHFHALSRAWQLGQGLRARHVGITLISLVLGLLFVALLQAGLRFVAMMGLLGLVVLLVVWLFYFLSLVAAVSLPFVALAGCYVDALAHHPELAE